MNQPKINIVFLSTQYLKTFYRLIHFADFCLFFFWTHFCLEDSLKWNKFISQHLIKCTDFCYNSYVINYLCIILFWLIVDLVIYVWNSVDAICFQKFQSIWKMTSCFSESNNKLLWKKNSLHLLVKKNPTTTKSMSLTALIQSYFRKH